jgi:cytochrome c oxidase cbb3-type subunit 2
MTHSHEKVETNVGLLAVLIAVAVSFGGLAEIVPLMFQAETIQPLPGVKPYPALQLAGRDVYVREGCYNCHSQMVRTLRFETERYGHYSLAGESVYDRPFQWGSKRTGPDLARVGGRYPDDWHRAHMNNPRDVVPESNMPAYAFLTRTPLKVDDLGAHLTVLRELGVPYTDDMIANAARDAYGQATPDSDFSGGVTERYGESTEVSAFDGVITEVTEMDALVAYLQVLGRLTDAASRDEAGVAPQAGGAGG